MSLLNEMLRDLSHQQKAHETAVTPAGLEANAQEQHELFHQTRAVKPLPLTLVPSAIIFIVVFSALLLWKMVFSADVASESALPVAETKTAIESTVAPASISTASTAPVALATPLTTNTFAQPVEQNSVAPALNERIAALESAINNLSAVVADANSQSAYDAGFKDSDFDRSTVSAMNLDDADSTGMQIEDEFLTPEQTGEASATSVSIQDPFDTQFAESQLANASGGESLAGQSAAEQGEPQFSISPNIRWQDQQLAQQANQLVAQGQSDMAIAKLQDYIASAAQPRESTKALLDIYVAQDNVSAIQTLLAQANYLSVAERSYYNAKIAVIQGDDTQAVKLLEAHLAEAEDNENYRALLAGLYQRTGMHSEAANHYRRLLSVFGDKPAYWLGFALSQDALNQSNVAVQAYQRVNQYADLQPQVRTYVQQRIAALQESP